jgi:hypothetical protein
MQAHIVTLTKYNLLFICNGIKHMAKLDMRIIIIKLRPNEINHIHSEKLEDFFRNNLYQRTVKVSSQ